MVERRKFVDPPTLAKSGPLECAVLVSLFRMTPFAHLKPYFPASADTRKKLRAKKISSKKNCREKICREI
jgi:hypothetical protein